MLDIIKDEKNLNTIKSLLKWQIEHFIDKDKQGEYKKMLGLDEEVVEYIRKIEFEEIFREGKQEGREEVVLNLLSDSDLDVDTISRISKIDVSRIIQLKRDHNIS